MVREWQKFFDAHAERYEENGFTQYTAQEVEFILKLYPLPKGSSILDVGCGTGRHAIEFARRGYHVTGLDISPSMLEVGRRNAQLAGVEVEWLQADATEFTLGRKYDGAVCLCEGGVGLLEQGEEAEKHDASILENIAGCLKPNAPFVMTALNGYSIIRQMKDEHIAEGRFDPSTMLANYVDEWDLPEGPTLMRIRERLFIPPEVTAMLSRSGFLVDNVYGGTAGHWGQRFLSLDEVEAMYICRKRPD